MDKHQEQPVRIEDLQRWARIAERFGAETSPEVFSEPVPMLKVGAYEIRNLTDWSKYWETEIAARHWDAKIAAIGVSEKPQNLKDLIRRIENRKKKPGDKE